MANDELLHTNRFDREVWRSEGEIWFVQRERTLPVFWMAIWFTSAAMVAVGAIGCGIGAALGGGTGFGAGAIALTLVTWWCVMRGQRHRRRDRAKKREHFRKLPHVRMIPARGELRDAADQPVPLGEIRLVTHATDMVDTWRYALILRWRDEAFEVMNERSEARLGPVIATLAALGISCGEKGGKPA